MALETIATYLVALSLPVWLVVEEIVRQTRVVSVPSTAPAPSRVSIARAHRQPA